MPFLYETHCHCAQCSKCAHSTAADMVRAYHSAGYAGLVLTDHFIFGNTAVPKDLPWEERMHRYYDAYLEAKAEGHKLDFDVIFGIEHFYGGGKEILFYGIDLAFLLNNPDIPDISIDTLVSRVHAAGGIAIHALSGTGAISTGALPRGLTWWTASKSTTPAIPPERTGRLWNLPRQGTSSSPAAETSTKATIPSSVQPAFCFPAGSGTARNLRRL